MILRRLENSRGFLLALLFGAFVLVILVASELGGELPNRAGLKPRPYTPDVTGLARKIEALFSPGTLNALRPATNGVSPFYTTHFQPPPPPPAPPPAPTPVPTSVKILLTYQGLYQSAGGEKKAFIKVGDGVVAGVVGAKVVADWSIAEIALRTLILKNPASQTNLIEFNVPKEIEIPNP